jgi:hypothetical protein
VLLSLRFGKKIGWAQPAEQFIPKLKPLPAALNASKEKLFLKYLYFTTTLGYQLKNIDCFS